MVLFLSRLISKPPWVPRSVRRYDPRNRCKFVDTRHLTQTDCETRKRATCLDNIHVKLQISCCCVYGLETSYYCIYMTNRSVVCYHVYRQLTIVKTSSLVTRHETHQDNRWMSNDSSLVRRNNYDWLIKYQHSLIPAISGRTFCNICLVFSSSLWYFYDYLFFLFS